MALSRSALFYRKNREAAKRKSKKDAELNKSRERTKKRVESNRKRREAKKAGKDIKDKDWDHKTKRFISVKANRGRKGEGGRKRKK